MPEGEGDVSDKSLVTFTNHGGEAIRVAIEPWAMLESIGPGQSIRMELPRDRPHETSVDLSMAEDGSVTISASYVQWKGDDWQVSFGRTVAIHLPDRVERFEC